jgi:hypothetical protein
MIKVFSSKSHDRLKSTGRSPDFRTHQRITLAQTALKLTLFVLINLAYCLSLSIKRQTRVLCRIKIAPREKKRECQATMAVCSHE